MKTNQRDYHRNITVDISAEEAFDAISHVEKWWATSFTGSAAKLQDEFSVNFGDTFVNFRISEVVPGKKIVWLVTDCNLHWIKDKKEWKDTEVVWEISPGKNGTGIRMTHVGLVPEVECYENCEEGWNFYVGQSLYKLMTEKKGLPNTPKSSR